MLEDLVLAGDALLHFQAKIPKSEQAFVIFVCSRLHIQLFAIERIFVGNFLCPDSLVLLSDTRQYRDYENAYID